MGFNVPPESELVEGLERRVLGSDPGALEELLHFYEQILRAAPGTREAWLSEHGPIYEPLGRLLDREATGAEICRWLLPLAPRCGLAQREALRICFLELLPEEPVSWIALEAIWMSFWNAPETRWVVLDAYALVPLKLKPHHQRFAALATARGQPFEPVDELEHAEMLRENSSLSDRHEMAAEIESCLAGTAHPWVWEELIYQPLVDPALEAVRERCARLDMTTEEGLKLLQRELRKLRFATDLPS